MLLGIEEEGIPFRIQTFRQVKLSIAPGWLLVNLPCGWHCLRSGKTDCALQKLTGTAPLFTLMYQQDNHARRSIGLTLPAW